MNKFLITCRGYLSPWIVGIIIVAIVGLIIFAPIVGVATLIVALPLIGCIVMCGVMAFFMKREKDL